MKKRGQVSLEFMFVFAIMLILLVYSVRNTTFDQGSQSVETLKIQIALEEKNLANSIANAVNQVYAQGPGAKTTVYTQVDLLTDPNYLQRAFGSSDITIQANGTSLRVWVGDAPIESGPSKNTVTSLLMYNFTTVRSISLNGGFPVKNVRIVAEWNPDNPESLGGSVVNDTYEIRININPGG